MAHCEDDREDIMREATAMPRRVEFTVTGTLTVVAGFRQTGWFSLYVDQDPVYHFTADGRLRRGFVQGLLYRSQGNCLARLSRRRAAGVSELIRSDVGDAELDEFLMQMHNCCRQIHSAITQGDLRVLGCVPTDDDALLTDVAAGLERTLSLPRSQALSAAINKRRR